MRRHGYVKLIELILLNSIKTPALSRVTSLTDEPIREDTEGEERAIATDGTTYS